VGADSGRRPHLQKRLWTRSAGREPNPRRSFKMQARRNSDQYFYARIGLRAGAVRAESNRNVPWQGVLHDTVHPGTIPADGLHVEKNQDYPLNAEVRSKNAEVRMQKSEIRMQE